MPKKTLITVILDESGSMMSNQEQVISGFNEFVQTQQDKGLGDCSVTLIKFNSENGADPVYADKDIMSVPKLTRRNYNPGGVTPLYDAVGEGITLTRETYENTNKILSQLTGHDTAAATPLVIFLIMTDGQENASKKYSRDQVLDLMAKARKDLWTFVFIGADMDNWSAQNIAQSVGVMNNTRQYASSQIRTAYADFARNLSAHRAAYTAGNTAADLDMLKSAISSNYYGADANTADDKKEDK